MVSLTGVKGLTPANKTVNLTNGISDANLISLDLARQEYGEIDYSNVEYPKSAFENSLDMAGEVSLVNANVQMAQGELLGKAISTIVNFEISVAEKCVDTATYTSGMGLSLIAAAGAAQLGGTYDDMKSAYHETMNVVKDVIDYDLVSNFLKKSGCSVANAAISLVGGVLSVVEGILDLATYIGGGVVALAAGSSVVENGGSIDDMREAMNKVWDGTKAAAKYDLVKSGKNLIYNTKAGQVLENNAYSPFKKDGWACGVASTVGEVAGIVAISVATAGIGTAATGTTLGFSQVAPVIAGLSKAGNSTSKAYNKLEAEGSKSGFSMTDFKALAYGTANGVTEAFSWWFAAEYANKCSKIVEKIPVLDLMNKSGAFTKKGFSKIFIRGWLAAKPWVTASFDEIFEGNKYWSKTNIIKNTCASVASVTAFQLYEGKLDLKGKTVTPIKEKLTKTELMNATAKRIDGAAINDNAAYDIFEQTATEGREVVTQIVAEKAEPTIGEKFVESAISKTGGTVIKKPIEGIIKRIGSWFSDFAAA